MQGNYVAALAKIGALPAAKAVRIKPIFQRDALASQKQAIADAATALSALWRARVGKQ